MKKVTTYPLSKKVKENRKRLKLTLDELAEIAGCSKSYIWELENRPVVAPSAYKLLTLARIFGVSVDYLVDELREFPTQTEIDNDFKRNVVNLDPEKRKVLESFIKAIS